MSDKISENSTKISENTNGTPESAPSVRESESEAETAEERSETETKTIGTKTEAGAKAETARPESAVKPHEAAPILTTSIEVDRDLLKRLGRKSMLFSIFAMSVGVFGIVLFFTLAVVFEILKQTKGWDTSLRFESAAALSFFVAIIGLIAFLISKFNERSIPRCRRENVYSFYGEYVMLGEIREGEDMGSFKMYYCDFFKLRENKQFILLYPNRFTFYPVEKAKLSKVELSALRSALKLGRR